jgi:hypothetical protein
MVNNWFLSIKSTTGAHPSNSNRMFAYSFIILKSCTIQMKNYNNRPRAVSNFAGLLVLSFT